MGITSTPSAFRNFSAANTNVANNSSSQKNSDTQSGALKSDEPQLKKGGGSHPLLKGVAAVLAAGVAFLYVVPMIRHNLFSGVNPSLININSKYGIPKRNFIVFSDQMEIKRRKTAEFLAGRFDKLKELIRRNFFSYSQPVPEKLSPIKDTPKNFVRGIISEINDFCSHIVSMRSRIPLDYESFTRN